MSLVDSLLNVMHMNPDDDEDYYDDDYADEEDMDPVPMTRRATASAKIRELDDYEEERPPVRRQSAAGKITPIKNPSSRKVMSGNMEVCVIKPTSVEDSREITETLLANRTVVLNLEGLDLEIAQRIIDFTSGAAFAISGNLQKISNYIFLVTPTNVDISGDLQDLLNTSFDASSMRSRF